MTTVEQEAVAHMGETAGAKNHDHDMVHELSRRLDALWRYDQYIANAAELDDLQAFWEKVKQQETENVEELKSFIGKHIEHDCF